MDKVKASIMSLLCIDQEPAGLSNTGGNREKTLLDRQINILIINLKQDYQS